MHGKSHSDAFKLSSFLFENVNYNEPGKVHKNLCNCDPTISILTPDNQPENMAPLVFIFTIQNIDSFCILICGRVCSPKFVIKKRRSFANTIVACYSRRMFVVDEKKMCVAKFLDFQFLRPIGKI